MEAAETVRAAPARLPTLTALRFVAALLVVGVHCRGFFADPRTVELLERGRVGVSFFFVLSGFVLAWSWSPAVGAREFAWRRWARVFPNHAVTWALAVGVGVLVERDPLHAKGSAAALALVQSWIPAEDYYFAANGPSWTLSCEALFYVCFPGLMALLLGRRARVLAAVASGCTAAVFAVPLAVGDGSLALWLVRICPATRLLEFALGVTLGVAFRQGWRPRVPLVPALLLAGAVGLLQPLAPTGLQAVAVHVVPLALVVVAAARFDLSGRRGPLGHPSLVKLGEWSFALYLVHEPVVRVLTVALDRPAYGPAGGGAVLLTVTVLSVAAAAVLHEAWERPVERRVRRWASRRYAAPALPLPEQREPEDTPAVRPAG